MPVILETRQITKRFGSLAAINDLSFAVEEGEIFGIAGPNGAGENHSVQCDFRDLFQYWRDFFQG